MDMVLLHTGLFLVHLDCQNVARPARIICDMEAEWSMATFCPGMPLHWSDWAIFCWIGWHGDKDSVQMLWKFEKAFATMCHVAGADGQLGGHARPTCCSSTLRLQEA